MIPVEDITVHMAQTYLLERANRVSNNSFNVYRKEGRRLFEWGKKQNLLPRHSLNPFAEVEKKRHETKNSRPAPIEHVIKTYMAATPDQKDLILTYLVTGGRKSEILKWEWSDIDFKNKIYALHTRKSGSGQVKTTYHEMPALLCDILDRRFKKRHPTLPYVFWHKFWDREKKEWREDRYQNLNRFTERICKKAGVPKFGLHQLRHLATAVLKERPTWAWQNYRDSFATIIRKPRKSMLDILIRGLKLRQISWRIFGRKSSGNLKKRLPQRLPYKIK